MGEVQTGDRRDLETADLGPTMTAVAGGVGDRDLAPRQGGEPLAQRGLVGLDDQQVGGMLVGNQPVGMLALGVERIGSDHGVRQVHALQ
jgi:hypothetical protein